MDAFLAVSKILRSICNKVILQGLQVKTFNNVEKYRNQTSRLPKFQIFECVKYYWETYLMEFVMKFSKGKFHENLRKLKNLFGKSLDSFWNKFSSGDNKTTTCTGQQQTKSNLQRYRINVNVSIIKYCILGTRCYENAVKTSQKMFVKVIYITKDFFLLTSDNCLLKP